MEATGTVSLVNNIYLGSISTSSWSPIDTTLFSRYGEPQVEIGGNFTDGMIHFSVLPTSYRPVMTQSPFTMSFPGLDDFQAGDKCRIWVSGICSRLKTIMQDLRSQDSTNYKGGVVIQEVI